MCKEEDPSSESETSILTSDNVCIVLLNFVYMLSQHKWIEWNDTAGLYDLEYGQQKHYDTHKLL